MNKTEYIELVQGMLFDDLQSKETTVPNGIMMIKAMGYSCSDSVTKEVIEAVENQAKWLEDYFANCKANARPIDYTLAHNMINALYCIQG